MDDATCDRLDDELCEAQFIWLKMDCYIMHNEGRTAEEIIAHLGAWKNMYRRNARFKTKAEQSAFLDAKMTEVFGEGGFPEEFVQKFKNI